MLIIKNPLNITSDYYLKNLLNEVVIDESYSHALETHYNDVDIVRECFSKNGAYMQFQIEKGKRYLRVCIIDKDKIGFQIVDIIGKIAKEKTCYIKDSIHNIKELLEYVKKMGYPRYKGPL